MDEGQAYAPIINFVNTEYGLIRVGIALTPGLYNQLNSEHPEVWQAYLGLLHEQVEENMRELSQGEHPQD